MVSKSFHYGGVEGVVRVTFSLPADLDAQAIYVVGDFNNWDRTALPMRRARGGPWMATVDMPEGRAFQFRYLRDGEWMVDEQADAYAFAGTTTRNGLVVTDPNYRV
jgi:1,4-alpha-glucan branching enzyme